MPLSMMSLDSSGGVSSSTCLHGRDDLLERLLERLHDLGAGERDGPRQARDEVAAADVHVQLALERQRGADAILTSSAVRSPIIRLYFLRM